MQEIYDSITINTKYDTDEFDFLTNSQNPQELKSLLQKTTLFDNIILQIQNNKVNVSCEQKKQKFISLYANKKNFFGLLLHNKIPNVTNRLDSFDSYIKLDFPFINPEIQFVQTLREKYFNKFQVKFEYTKILFPVKKQIQISAQRTSKTNYNYIAGKVKIDELIQVGQIPLNLEFNHFCYYDELEKINQIPSAKISYKQNTINRSTLPIGQQLKAKFQHSILCDTNQYFAYVKYKKFFYPYVFPKNSNLEFQYKLLLTNSFRYGLYNQRGFKNQMDRFLKRTFSQSFLGIKFNYYDTPKLDQYNCNFFGFLSTLYSTDKQFNWSLGIGIEKQIDNVGQLECIFNLKENQMQIRLEREQLNQYKLDYTIHQFNKIKKIDTKNIKILISIKKIHQIKFG